MASQEPLSPEYTAFRKCYQSVVATIKQEIGEFSDQLFSNILISEDDRDLASTVGLTDSDKARRLANAVTDRIKQDPKVFHRFLELEIVKDRYAVAKKLKECFMEGPPLKKIKIDQENTQNLSDSGPPTDSRLITYNKYLRSYYQVKESPSADQWPTPPTKKVFKLAMIKEEEIKRGEIDDKFVQMTITGKIDDILKHKTPIELPNIFSDIKDDERRFVLIEGAPGTGKSTLAHHMIKEWGRGKLYQEYKAVVHVALRDPGVKDAKSLADLLPCANKAMATEAEAAMTESLGEGVLVVLDGWDELSSDLPADSIIHKLVQPGKFRGSPIPKAGVVITSRPTSSAELHPLVSSRIEVLGFTPKELEKYFKECLKGDSQAVKSLLERIRENPVVEASCYIPFVASIIAHVVISGDGKLPGSNTGIFKSLVLFCLSRYLQKNLGKSEDEATLTSLEDLPQPLSDLFPQLCSLAYYGITTNKVTFVADDFQSAGVDPKVCDLGLLQAVHSTLVHRKECYYNFLHLSIQELLAAIHISHMSESEQMSVFEKLFGNPRFTAVFQFYSGITKLKICRPIVSRLVQSGDEYSDTYKAQLVSLLHCLYEAEDPSLCELVADGLNKRRLYLAVVTLSPLDCLCIGYFLCVVAMTTSGVLNMNLLNCSIGDQGCKLFYRGFRKYHNHLRSNSTGRIKLDLIFNDIHGEGARHIAELVKHTNVIHHLDLSDNPIGNNGVKCLCEALCTNTTLEYLHLGYCSITLSDDTGPALSQLLGNNKSIKTLNLSLNSCTDCRHLAAGLSNNKTLTTLRLVNCGLTDDSVEQLCTGLANNIDFLDLNNLLSLIGGTGSHNSFTENGLQHLAGRVTTLSALEVLSLPKNLKSSGGPLFRKVNEERKRNGLKEIRVDYSEYIYSYLDEESLLSENNVMFSEN